MTDIPRITAEELKGRIQAGEEFTLIDVRNPKAWAQSSVKADGAIRVPLEGFEEHLQEIPRNKPVVTYCT
ncbi:MAG TPA: rhodanese-like domain-containing protein [Terriglobales bacterium]|jgi:rhodanese-related sulfurtransferase